MVRKGIYVTYYNINIASITLKTTNGDNNIELIY